MWTFQDVKWQFSFSRLPIPGKGFSRATQINALPPTLDQFNREQFAFQTMQRTTTTTKWNSKYFNFDKKAGSQRSLTKRKEFEKIVNVMLIDAWMREDFMFPTIDVIIILSRGLKGCRPIGRSTILSYFCRTKCFQRYEAILWKVPYSTKG